jgi:hypothetical protein
MSGIRHYQAYKVAGITVHIEETEQSKWAHNKNRCSKGQTVQYKSF